MLILLLILCPLLILCVASNLSLQSKLKIKIKEITDKTVEFEKLKSEPPKKVQSIELQEFLADLMAGPAILAIARVDPNSMLLRSPKQR